MKRSGFRSVVLFFCAAALLFFFGACDSDITNPGGSQITGSGNIVSQNRSVPTFHGINAGIVGNVSITQGAAQSVRIETDDNLVNHVTTTVSGGILRIDVDTTYNTEHGIRVYLNMTEARSIQLAGVGDINAGNISSTGTLTVNLNGVGSVTLFGTVDILNASINGTGNIVAENLQARAASITIAGNGDCRITVNAELNAIISGNGNIYYAGNPPVVNSTVTGNGEVRPL